ncbi:MAG: methylmalonyl-CoA mutase [Deltaproteobacteria bacterium CG12_big_fil_rev_8_21_14_0_65_43_10]|nr:MAG: methylmalonyl-CoA mutase [Deltaproteobacteria bacterium CG12_big_fil_rev_8_21_14_0_65_43_10]PIX22353.1 MAG: methylmalonyl-CoA mutase [Deltaproteobacteria bacterium CG_4_8_14_3_um_filter_43_13]PIZ18765.1 MAG: methylmalonyl-CoA mutase [Deltaproteobacteria bacterium CG_4_10_14_0_8_um_filter_43_12]HCX89409.1 methylmalonyl-CoA mutase [Deltaproteobacteria bacterium]
MADSVKAEKREDTKIDGLMEAYFEKPKRLTTWSGFPIKDIYTPADLEGIDYEGNIANAGDYPFTRGIHSNMYRGRYWTMREGSGYARAADTNKRLKFLASQGVSGFSIFRDLPTVWGIDADHPMAEGEVGLSGVNLTSLKDMEGVLDGIALDKVSVALLCASSLAPVIFSQYLAVAENRGIDIAKLRGTIANDPLHSRYCYGKPSNPIDLSVKLAVDIIEFCTKHMPLWNTNSVNAYDMRETGINAPEEIAFGFGIAMEYIRKAVERGLNVDDFASRISFYFSAGMDFLEEIAKLRAARRLWAKIMKERFGAKKPGSWKFRFGVHTAGSSLVPQQPLNNIIRITIEALVAILGGVQSLHCCSYDEPIALPSEESQRIALRTQQILAYETGVANTADPLGGSYFIENLTNKLEEEAVKIIKEIDEMGGMAEAMKKEWVDQKIDQAALQLQKEIENKERVIVGVNAFTTAPEDKTPGGVYRIPPETEREQIANVKSLKETRDRKKVKETIRRLREKAQMGEGENLIPSIIEALKAYATVGEIQGTIRAAYGLTYDPFDIMKSPY